MKRTTLIGLLILGLIFQSCKDTKTEQDTLIIEETETVVQPEVDTTSFSSSSETVETITSPAGKTETITKTESKTAETSKPVVPVTKTTEKVVVKTTTETTKPVVKEEVVVEKVVVKEAEPKVEAKVEPKVVEKPVVLASASDWVVPANFKNMKNPTDAKDKENLSIGKSLYAKQCSSCHGSKGWGDGSKAKEMKGDLGDFSKPSTQNQTDGELYYKITEGRADMPGFSKKIPSAEDRWLVVNYMRTLKR